MRGSLRRRTESNNLRDAGALIALKHRAVLALATVVGTATVFAASAMANPVRSAAEAPPDPDVEQPPLTARRGNWLLVPIPFSNPTLDSGLVLAGGYFHPQTEAQKAVQPPSITGAGAMYSGNGSYAGAVANASYWDEDRWRFTGVAGYANLDLPLVASTSDDLAVDLDWKIDGFLGYAELSRRVAGDWYAGLAARYLDIEQTFSLDISSRALELANSVVTSGLGLSLVHDTRDLPSNPFSGHHLRFSMFANSKAVGSDTRYQAYDLGYQSYHQLTEPLVIAWELAGCMRSGDVPLWDACRIPLRGFASTDYMGKSSAIGQVEARWRVSKRWGFVAFAGGGQVADTLSGRDDHELIPSYGIGIRFLVQQANRINLRLDYGRSTDSDAIYFSVAEAF